MPGVMMLSREAKRVPLDFDWPPNKVWKGYLDYPTFPQCAVCDGDGIHPLARPITDSFYALYVNDEQLRRRVQWADKITQDEVDHLLEKGRLQSLVRDNSERGRHWEKLPRSADEINSLNRSAGLDSHDGINRGILCAYRCERLGIPYECEICQGHGDIATEAERSAAEAWAPTEPPEGEGWQMWESVSEGSPITPVFESPEALAEWLVANDSSITSSLTANDWLAAIRGEVVGTDVSTSQPIRSKA